MKDSFNSRYSRTQKSKKKNMILNALIGVVFIGILAVGASMLLGDDEKASTEPTSEKQDSTTPEPKEKSNDSAKDDSSSENEEKKSESTNEDKNDDKKDSESVEMSDEDKEEQDKNESNGEYKSHTDETAGPDGSWEAVGTKQQGDHTNSFEEGSVDWEEKQRALQYATGLSPDEITYWWIGNGGSSSTAKGVVSKAENKAEPFVVMLEWVDGQGWKPTSVERVPGAADNN